MKVTNETCNVAIPAHIHRELKAYSEVTGMKMTVITGEAVTLWLKNEGPKYQRRPALVGK